MTTLTRVNPLGHKYLLEGDKKKTTISLGNKKITVNVPIDVINAAWYNWSQQGQFIQKAFNMLNADEREFLMTGITKEEWDAMFNSEGSINLID